MNDDDDDYQPASGLTRSRLAAEKMEALRGNLSTGCREIDTEVLGGGFERGCVVGLSTEAEEAGLLIGAQTIARLLVAAEASGVEDRPKVMIITKIVPSKLVPVIRGCVTSQAIPAYGDDIEDGIAASEACLDHLLIEPVFDFQGLSLVLDKLEATKGTAEEAAEAAASSKEDPEKEKEDATTSQQDQQPSWQLPIHPPSSTGTTIPRPPPKTPPPPPPPYPPPRTPTPPSPPATSAPPTTEPLTSPAPPAAPRLPFAELVTNAPPRRVNKFLTKLPDIILVTQMSHILTTLFRAKDKARAHQELADLAKRLRQLAQDREYGGPLIMLLNSTSLPSSTLEAATMWNSQGYHQQHQQQHPRNQVQRAGPSARQGGGGSLNRKDAKKAVHPMVRSIFHQPEFSELLAAYYDSYEAEGGNTNMNTNTNTTTTTNNNKKPATSRPANSEPIPTIAIAAAAAARKNKPAYGKAFAQLVNLHLLATRLPRSRDDAFEVVMAGMYNDMSEACPRVKQRLMGVRFLHIIEVLHDQMGGVRGGAATVAVAVDAAAEEDEEQKNKDKKGKGKLREENAHQGEQRKLDGKGAASREKNWGVIDIVSYSGICDAFSRPGTSYEDPLARPGY